MILKFVHGDMRFYFIIKLMFDPVFDVFSLIKFYFLFFVVVLPDFFLLEYWS